MKGLTVEGTLYRESWAGLGWEVSLQIGKGWALQTVR